VITILLEKHLFPKNNFKEKYYLRGVKKILIKNLSQ